MRNFLILFIGATAILMNGCAPARQNPKSVALSTDSINGTVLYSISTTKNVFSNYYLEIFNLESRTKEKLYRVSEFNPDIKEDSVSVHYNAVTLPAGEYKIFGWSMVYLTGNGTKTFFPMGNFSIPFTVAENSVNYLGDYLGVPTMGRNIIGLKIPVGGYFIASERYEKDYQVISSRFPKLDLKGTVNAMPDFTKNNSRYSRIFLKGINIP